MDVRPFTDHTEWNKFIETHNPWAFFQSWEWGEVQKKIRHEVIRWGFFDQGQLTGVAQIILVEAKRGTFLHIRHGPVFAIEKSQLWDLFIRECRKLGRNRNCDFIRVSPMIENSPNNRKLMSTLGFRSSPIHRMDGEICWVLNLGKTEEEILTQMRKTTRYLIRHAEKTGVKICESTDVDRFLSLYIQTAKRQEFVPHQGIREEYILFSKAKKAHLFMAQQDNNLLAASIFIRFGSQFIYHHSASVPSKTGASYFLQWYAIRFARKLGLRYYNFWGIAPGTTRRHPWNGITLFKQGFGGEEKQFIHAQDLPLTSFYFVTWLVETIRRIYRGY